MRITDLLKPSSITIGATASGRDDAIDQLVALHQAAGNLNDPATYKEAVLAREAEFSTAVGDGIAIPHGKSAAVNQAGLAAMTVPAGVDWNAPDEKPCDLVFMIAAPEGKNQLHLEMLAKLSALLMHEDFASALRAAKTPEDFIAVINEAETARDAADAAKAAAPAPAAAAAPANDGYPQILAITACPTGIAHTYMAAENLEKKAAERGILLKAETRGSAGAKNVHTADEIAHAKGIIVAADTNVDLARFDGKPVYVTNVTAGINDADHLIDVIMNDEAPIHHAAAGSTATASEGEKDSVGHTLYKALMNGVSHMLPFVVGGGILTAIAFLVDQPGLGTSSYGSSIAAAAFFKTIGDVAMGLMLPILSAYIAQSIADRPAIAPGFVGGMFAKYGYSIAYLSTLDDSGLVSGGFIAAMFAGFAAGYIMLGLEKLCDHLPNSLEGIKPMLIYPVGGVLAIGAIMLLLNPIFAMINTAVSSFLTGLGTGNLVLLGAVLGGMMSIDMGGPFNKAAYAFGTMALDASSGLGETGQIIMASVMIGGMVPPLVIALSTTFFKNRWTKADRDAGLVNYIMGLSFISEGAIPYATADPGRVIPSCIIGSAIAGGLSALFGCTSPAPHGGAWVVAVIGNWPMWLLALVIGSVAGALILSFWKKPLPAEQTGLEAK